MTLVLNADQERCLAEIMAAFQPGGRYLLTGYAGSGKTTLMQEVARRMRAARRSIVLTAPTHKAVAVLAGKAAAAGLADVPSATIHSLLCLRPKAHADRLIFERDRRAEPVMADVVVIDECSMISAELMVHIRRHLPLSFVLFVGDPAQLPPVGEKASQSFETPGRSHLDTIIRQAAGNPVLEAAHAIRASQGGEMDWSWCREAIAPPWGVYIAGGDAQDWMREAFTSEAFSTDADSFRYLCWTNERVNLVNTTIRRWRYGDVIPTPLMPGERALLRGPVVRGGNMIFLTNEEADVVSIQPGTFIAGFMRDYGVEPWSAPLPSWEVELRRADGTTDTVHMVRSERDYNAVIARATDEARVCRGRWAEIHDLKASLAKLQSVYAMTVHTSQGSTFRNAFIDVADIRRRLATNLLEAQQLFYVAATRPTDALVLVNA